MSIPELLLTFTASLLASYHCAAMCGGFTLSLARPGRGGSSLARLAAYHAGKLFTYVFIGGIAGSAGAALLSQPALRSAQAVFSALAGIAIVVVGLQTLGLVPGQSIVHRAAGRLWLGQFFGPIVRTFSRATTLDGAFLLGVVNGFLPCGLVYAFALAAAGTGSPLAAMFSMLAFGLGTVPVLALVGLGGGAVAAWWQLRPTLARGSGLLLIVLGGITALRGLPLASTSAAGLHVGHAAHGVLGSDQGQIADLGLDLEPGAAPDFTLVNQSGRAVSLADFSGKVVAIDFIYTTCKLTCPLLTAKFKALQDSLAGALGNDVVLVSISVDPERDTPEVLQAFGEKWEANFDGWAFLTGRPEDIDAVMAGYAIYAEGAGDNIAHSETILLIDRQGRLRSAFSLRAESNAILNKVRALMREAVQIGQ